MSESRDRRPTKRPKKYDANEDAPESKQEKWVFRLLQESEVTEELLDQALYLFWPDDSTWYPAEVKDVDVTKKRADIFYVTTDEEENVDLAELIGEKSIAFRESRPSSHTLAEGEVWDEGNNPVYTEKQPEPSNSEEDEPEEDDDDEDAEVSS